MTTGVALRSDLRFDLGYSFAVHTFEKWSPSPTLNLDGNEMDGAPRHQRSAQVTYSPSVLRGGRLQLEWLGLCDYFIDPQNTLRQDGYNVFHLRGSLQVRRHYEVFARVINLFDRLYAEQGFLGDRYVPRYLSPGEYRTVYAGIGARF